MNEVDLIENQQIKALQKKKLSRQEKERLLVLLRERKRRRELITIEKVYASLYLWQLKFISKTDLHRACMLMAANRVGKTYTGCLVDAIHATGDYPADWQGHRFKHAPLIWVLGFSGEKIRDLLQSPIFGMYSSGELSGGLVQKGRILDALPMMGTPRTVREVRVKHSSGGIARVQFWSYSQGQHALMGDSVDWYHIDEEPKDRTIFPQVVTRTATGDKGKGGRGILTFTPENGRTELVVNFMDDPSPSQYMQRATWDDAEHLTAETKEALLDQFPPYQREMRTKGLPLLGTGLIFDLPLDPNEVPQFECPDHFYIINGMDFGWEHPQAHVQLWWDKDEDVIYVARAWKQSKTQAYEAWQHIKSWAKDVPTSFPHDAYQEKDQHGEKKAPYEDAGWNMLDSNATWEGGGNSVETGLIQIYNLIRLNKLRFFDNLTSLKDELLQYHRNEKGFIVKVNDDLIDAMRYAYMMRRFAVRKYDIVNQNEYDDYEESATTEW